MRTETVAPLHIVGIAIRTTNQNGQAANDIPLLWQRFFAGNILASIPNKVDDTLYCIYTDYEKDHTLPYTTVLGCKVHHLKNVPENLTAKTFDGGTYQVFTTKGDIHAGMVFNAWQKIWGMDLPRAYTADFEVYGPKVANPAHAEVDIYIAITHPTL